MNRNGLKFPPVFAIMDLFKFEKNTKVWKEGAV
jgi:hypothetical protein